VIHGDSTSTDYNPLGWETYKIVVKQLEQEYYNVYTNPLGWETYKIVVKQLEQEYYNVYTNGAIKADPLFTTSAPNQNTSFITLLNDNINKIPRDLSEVGPHLEVALDFLVELKIQIELLVILVTLNLSHKMIEFLLQLTL
jgi:hypothetical protein